MRTRSAYALLLGLAVLSGSAACAQGNPDDESADEVVAAPAAQVDALQIHTSESPSQSSRFTFCATPPPEAPLHLANAAWLALASANQYSHLGYFAPQLLDLGFGSPADSLWAQCGRDLGRARDFEIAHERELAERRKQGAAALLAFMRHRDTLDPENFGVCAREFLEQHYTGLDEAGEPQLPADAFKDYLLRRNDDTNWIQFLSAKPYTLLERVMKRGSTQVMIARHGTLPVVVVAFRGTEPPSTSDLQARDVIDVIKDLDIFKSNLENYGFGEGWGYAHRGFVTALQSVDDTENTSLLSNKIRALTGGDPNVGVFITGHSLGGALATLMTARLLDLMDRGERFTLRGLYTFGSPMVGNDTFKQRMEDAARRHGVPLVRFRNDQDAVTGVPGVRAFLNYHHVGRLVLLSHARMDLPSPEPGIDKSSVLDHSMAGLLGPAHARKKTSGYYSRIVEHLGKAPELTGCGGSSGAN